MSTRPVRRSRSSEGRPPNRANASTLTVQPGGGASIGGIKGKQNEFWKGKLDELRVYDRALNGSEIAQLAGLSTTPSILNQGYSPGQKVWEFVSGTKVNSSPAIGADGTVYVWSVDNKVYALKGATGAKQWEFETGDDVYSYPTVGMDGIVYIGSGDNKVYALDGETGAKRIPAFTKTVVDTVGAGDAFFAVSAPFVAAGAAIADAGFLGNVAGAVQVGIVGHRNSVEKIPFVKFLSSLLA